MKMATLVLHTLNKSGHAATLVDISDIKIRDRVLEQREACFGFSNYLECNT